MLGGLFFTLFRLAELTTLIPIIGMLAYFVNLYVTANQLTPNYILVLFIVATLAGAWALGTLFKQSSVRRNGHFVALVDLGIAGALIAGVYFLRFVTNVDCINVYGGPSASANVDANGNTILFSYGIDYRPFGISDNKTCSMLKASFALGIMNIIFFFTTSFIAVFLRRRERDVVEKVTYRRGSHGSR